MSALQRVQAVEPAAERRQCKGGGPCRLHRRRILRGRGSSRRARPPLSPEAYLAEGVRLGMTLLLLAVLEGTLLPLLLYVLLRAG